MKTNKLHITSLKGFRSPAIAQYWSVNNDECVYVRGIFNT